jgi:hypothetical protein
VGDGSAGETVTKLTHDEIGILRRYGLDKNMYLCTGFRQDFLPCVQVDTKWVHKLLVTEWSISHKTKKKHIVTKDVVGLLLGEIVSTKKHTHRRKGCGWLTNRR